MQYRQLFMTLTAVDEFFGKRIESARRHYLLDVAPYALERVRVTGQHVPEIVDLVDVAGPHDIVVDRAHSR